MQKKAVLQVVAWQPSLILKIGWDNKGEGKVNAADRGGNRVVTTSPPVFYAAGGYRYVFYADDVRAYQNAASVIVIDLDDRGPVRAGRN